MGERDGRTIRKRSARCRAHIAFGIDAAQLRGLDEAVEERGDIETASRTRPVMIFPAEDHGSQAALRLIVVERDARVVEKAREAAPQSEQNSLRHGAG